MSSSSWSRERRTAGGRAEDRYKRRVRAAREGAGQINQQMREPMVDTVICEISGRRVVYAIQWLCTATAM